MITIIDYGVGNLLSIQNMLKKVGAPANISSNAATIKQANKLILPGVGSFDYGMNQLRSLGLVEILNEKVLKEKTPIMGICLGFQLLTKSSEEGISDGLGWIDAATLKFDFSSANTNLKIPHMGWNDVIPQKESALLHNIPQPSRFYFVHSYYVKLNLASDDLLHANYGQEFACAVEHENILGVQFHPEKSHTFGKQLLSNFVEFY